MLNLLVIWACKALYRAMRLAGRHGAALPGLVAEKLRPTLLRKLTMLPDGIIVVSGTNGKTTTTHLVAEVLRRSGKRVFTNHSGSNMTRGLLAAIIRFSDWRGRLPFDVAVLEIDEAYAAKLGPTLRPRGAILTNVLRDQLDRFGEIDYTARLLFDLAASTTDLVVYNVCDSRLASIPSLSSSARLASFGYAEKLAEHFVDDDGLYGVPKSVPTSDVTLEAFDSSVHIRDGQEAHSFSAKALPGWHNALNLTAVYTLLSRLYGIRDDASYSDLTPPYGRGETITIRGVDLILQLVKNPVGFRTAMFVHVDRPALIVINDRIADGRDVSWLWDVDVEPLRARPSLFCSGTRGYDMALRLKYTDLPAGASIDTISAINSFIDQGGGVIFLTYTAMLDIRRYLTKLRKVSKK